MCKCVKELLCIFQILQLEYNISALIWSLIMARLLLRKYEKLVRFAVFCILSQALNNCSTEYIDMIAIFILGSNDLFVKITKNFGVTDQKLEWKLYAIVVKQQVHGIQAQKKSKILYLLMTTAQLVWWQLVFGRILLSAMLVPTVFLVVKKWMAG